MGYRNYATAVSHIVDTNGQGDFTTIAAALTAASSGQTIFIRPGTYTENPTLKAGVNLTAFGSDASLDGSGKVIINGKCTFTAAGSVTISGIMLQTNSDFLLAVTGSAASIVNLQNCYLNISNNTGISFTSSSGSAQININSCFGNIGTTGIAIFSSSSSGNLGIFFSDITNTGAATTASTISAGGLTVAYTTLQSPITSSSTTATAFNNGIINTQAINTTALTIGGSGTNSIISFQLSSGTASALSVGSTLAADNISIGSLNTNAITGAGTINYGNVTFTNTSRLINTTTQAGLNSGTFTPVITGTTTAGTGTYTLQVGHYTRIENMVFIRIRVAWSAHTGTGNTTVTGLPFTSANVSNLESTFIIAPAFSQTTVFGAAALTPVCFMDPNTSTIVPYTFSSSAGTLSARAMSGTGDFVIYGHYEI